MMKNQIQNLINQIVMVLKKENLDINLLVKKVLIQRKKTTKKITKKLLPTKGIINFKIKKHRVFVNNKIYQIFLLKNA